MEVLAKAALVAELPANQERLKTTSKLGAIVPAIRSTSPRLHTSSSSRISYHSPPSIHDRQHASSAVLRRQSSAELDTPHASLSATLPSLCSPYSLPHSSQCTSETACVQSNLQPGRSSFNIELRHPFQRRPRQRGCQQDSVFRSLQVWQQPGYQSGLPVLHGRIDGSVGCCWRKGYRARYAPQYMRFRQEADRPLKQTS